MIIRHGLVIDPANDREGVFDILIKNGKIEKVAKDIKDRSERSLDASGKIVVPGLIDMHVHLREPGREDMETVASGTRAAVAGGITSLCAMPNTYPPIDSLKTVKLVKDIIKKNAVANVFIVGAVTDQRRGERLADARGIKKEGVIALTDDGNSVQNASVMLDAIKKAKENGLFLMSHCEDKAISKNGVVNEGIVATKLGLRGVPKRAEYEFVERDIRLAEKAKSDIHISHVSCKESVDIIRKAKKRGANVTAETAPHYFSLCDSCCETYDTRTKINPPLRSKEDVEAIKEGLKDGTIDAIATDHAPHGKHEKEIEFENAAFGIIGLETSLALAIINLLNGKVISWKRLVELMSAGPARILSLKNKGSLSPGKDADIAVIDPQMEWVYAKDSIISKSKNSPFIDWRFKGRVTDTIIGGRVVFQKGRFT